jgi:hypothetical protein
MALTSSQLSGGAVRLGALVGALTQLGNRFVGMPGEALARDFVKAQFAAGGLAAELEPFNATTYRPRVARAVLSDGTELRCAGLQYTASGACSAPAIYLGGELGRAAGEPLAGRIAVIDGPFPFRHAAELARRGAAAIVVISSAPAGTLAHYTAELYPRRPDPRGPLPVPGVVVDAADRERLIHDGVALRVEHAADYAQVSTANVVATVRGGALAHERVIVVAHYDSQIAGLGAWDNGSGLAAMLVLARAWAAAPTARTAVFVATAEEEQGVSGAIEYCRRNAADAAHTLAVVNLDTLAWTANGTLDLQVDPAIREPALALLKQAGCVLRETADASLAPGADHHPFIDAGVPGVWLWPGPPSNPNYHSAQDVVANIDFECAARHAGFVEQLARGLAEDRALRPTPSRPARRWITDMAAGAHGR